MDPTSAIARTLTQLLLVVLLWWWAPWARAESAQPYPDRARVLLPSGCAPAPFDAVQLLEVLRIELLSSGVQLDAGPGRCRIIVDAPACTGVDLTVQVEHLGTGESAQERLDLGDRPRGERSRVLALAIAELLRSSWASLSQVPEAVDEPPPPPPIVVAPAPPVDVEALGEEAAALALRRLQREARRRARQQPGPERIRASLSLHADLFPITNGALIGPRLHLSVRLTDEPWLWLSMDAGYGYGGGHARQGEVITHGATGGVGLSFEGGAGPLRLGAGPRLEAGWGWTEGRTDREDVVTDSGSGFLLTVAATSFAQVALSERIALRTGLWVGYVLVGLLPLSEGRGVGGVAGISVGLDLALSLRF